MTLFQPAVNTSAYLKSGFLGFQGSGKSMTLSLLAIGLVLHMRKKNIEYANRPVFFLDTETGSDWVKPIFEEMGVDLHVAKTRAFVDLIAAIDEAEKAASFLLVDSVTHFWTELTSSYSRAKAKQLRISSGIYRLQFQDWAFLKGDQGWQKFTDRYINSPLHMGVAGRAGYEYDYFEDDDGKKQLEKTGVKMKAEGEFGFEPSLLVQMETKQRLDGKAVEKVWREAHVMKDRSTLIDGKTFFFTGEDNDGKKLSNHDLVLQTFRAFQPHINRLNLGGAQLGVDTQRTSEHTIPSDKKDWTSTQRTIVLEEIEALLAEHYPSTKVEDKQARATAKLKHFKTRSDTELALMPVPDLRAGFDDLYFELTGEHSRYASLLAPTAEQLDIDDELPDHSAPPAQAEAAPPKSIEELLIADLQTLGTPDDCIHWTQEVAKREDLEPMARVRISSALIARMAVITAKPAPEPSKPEPEPEKAEAKPKADSKPKRRLETAEDFKKASAELKGEAPIDTAMAIGG